MSIIYTKFVQVDITICQLWRHLYRERSKLYRNGAYGLTREIIFDYSSGDI